MAFCWDGSLVPIVDIRRGGCAGQCFRDTVTEVWNGAACVLPCIVVSPNRVRQKVCRLCSGYGVPALDRSRPMSFEIQRMSLVDSMASPDWKLTKERLEREKNFQVSGDFS